LNTIKHTHTRENGIISQADYLLDNKYDHKLEMVGNKSWRPTGKEFQTLACFLIKKLDPKWQCGAKFEDEVIYILMLSV
jgi:SMC interacting uncharacterized protein involved in chromosome segregation